MIPIRSRFHLTTEEDKTVIHSSWVRRIVFMVVLIVLIGGFVYGSGDPIAMWKNSPPAALFYLSMTVASLAVCGWNKKIIFDNRRREVRFARTLFRIPLPDEHRPISYEEVREVSLLKMQFVKTGVKKKRDEVTGEEVPVGIFGSMLERRSRFFRLVLQRDTEIPGVGRVLIEEGSYPEELVTIGGAAAESIGVPFREHQI